MNVRVPGRERLRGSSAPIMTRHSLSRQLVPRETAVFAKYAASDKRNEQASSV